MPTTAKLFIGGTQITNIPDPVNSGLTLHYDVGNSTCYPGSGSTLFDLSSTGLNASHTGTVAYSSNCGGYLVFSGNEYITTASSSVFNWSGTFSMESWLWISPSTETSNVYYGWFDVGTSGSTLIGSIWRSGVYPGRIYTTSVSAGNMFGTDGSAYIGADQRMSGYWSHIVFTKDSSNTARFYINGDLWASKASVSFPNTSNPFTYGKNANEAYNFLGRFSVLRVYNKALSASEVEQNYLSSVLRFSTNY